MSAFRPPGPLPHQIAGKAGCTWHGVAHEDDATEPVPRELNTTDHPRFLAVSKDKLTVRYVGRGNHSQDVGAVRTDWPCPQRCLLYYFEVTVEDSGTRGSIAVGMADAAFHLNRQPGWEANSYAYHGYDGRRYNDSERGEQYGPRFGAGDVIGCGLLTERREIFFTKNGENLGVAFSGISGRLHPTVGLHSPGEVVSINLGALPFAFDIEHFIRAQRDAQSERMLASSVPVDSIDSLVRGYLMHFGYEETLASLEQPGEGVIELGAPSSAHPAPPSDATTVVAAAIGAGADEAAPMCAADASINCGMTKDNVPVQGREEGPEVGAEAPGGSSAGGRSYPAAGACVGACAAVQVNGCAPDGEEAVLRRTIPLRRQLRSFVLAGKVSAAVELTESLYPGLLSRSVALHFRLRCQSFIELIRAAKPMEALAYAQAELAFYQMTPSVTAPSVTAPSGASAGAGSGCTEVAGLDLRVQLEEVISL